MTRNIKQTVLEQLQALGWTPSDGAALARKSFATAVGPKEGLMFYRDAGQGAENAFLTGEYYSEGRNVLSTCWQPLPKGASDMELQQRVQKFAAECEVGVAQSYAAKLFATYG